jgi:uncharacterized protein YheU (UPF0270 family)
MANFVAVPVERLDSTILQALLEEFASRDGTDYGRYELTLEQKVADLSTQLHSGHLQLLYDSDSEQWDLVPREEAANLLEH